MMEIQDELAALRAEVKEDLKGVPTREEREEATKWLGYEWDGILKFLRYLDADTNIDIPDEVRAGYQTSLYQTKLEAVRKKAATADNGLVKPIR